MAKSSVDTRKIQKQRRVDIPTDILREADLKVGDKVALWCKDGIIHICESDMEKITEYVK